MILIDVWYASMHKMLNLLAIEQLSVHPLTLITEAFCLALNV